MAENAGAHPAGTENGPIGQAPGPVPATISALVDGQACLLVRRANRPDAGRWGFPGGKVEPGETIHAAALRELSEETGLRARAGEIFTAVDVFDRDQNGTLHRHYILIAVLCHNPVGTLAPGADAQEARWFDLAELAGAELATSFDVADVAGRAVQFKAAYNKEGRA
jgi:ADP-ribose pyrophosphatase YjhB (NUDIX family)